MVHELDRVFDGDDVIGAGLVDMVDHRAERRRLARTGGTGHEHEAFFQLAEFEHMGRQAELLGGQDVGRDDAEDGAGAVPIPEHVRPEPGQAGDFVREVGVVTRFVLARG